MKVLRWSGMMAVCAAALAACSESDFNPVSIVGTRMDLGQAEQLWEESAVDDYDMTVRITGAWFGGTARVAVRNGVPVAVETDGDSPELIANVYHQYDTVEELFAIVQDAASGGADHIDAQFDQRLGLPVEVYIDHSATTADDEHGFWLEAFTIR